MDQQILEDNIDELLLMMEECPFLNVQCSSDMGVHICGNSDCGMYCVNCILDDICGNEEIMEFLEEKEAEE